MNVNSFKKSLMIGLSAITLAPGMVQARIPVDKILESVQYEVIRYGKDDISVTMLKERKNDVIGCLRSFLNVNTPGSYEQHVRSIESKWKNFFTDVTKSMLGNPDLDSARDKLTKLNQEFILLFTLLKKYINCRQILGFYPLTKGIKTFQHLLPEEFFRISFIDLVLLFKHRLTFC